MEALKHSHTITPPPQSELCKSRTLALPMMSSPGSIASRRSPFLQHLQSGLQCKDNQESTAEHKTLSSDGDRGLSGNSGISLKAFVTEIFPAVCLHLNVHWFNSFHTISA